MNLIIPNKVTNIHNNSGTFKVYDAGEAIGATSPNLLGEMGMPPLPRNVLNSTDRSNFLNGVPKMTPEQINDFLRRLKDGGK